MVVLEGYTAWLPTDAELEQLLSKSVLLDVEAARVIQERGYGSWLGVQVGEKTGFGGQSECHRAGVINPVEQRISFRGNRWRHLKARGAEVVSELIDSRNRYHLGSTIFTNPHGGRVAIYNSVGELASGSFGDHARLTWLHGMLTWLNRGTFSGLPKLPHHGLCLVRTRGTEQLVALANLGSDVMTSLSFELAAAPDQRGVMLLGANAPGLRYRLPARKMAMPEGGCSLSLRPWAPSRG